MRTLYRILACIVLCASLSANAALDAYKNFAKGTVSIGYSSAATTIVLSTGHGSKFPAPPFNATWWNSTDYSDPADDPFHEVVRVTGVSTDTLTITRAQESTSALNHNTVARVYKLVAGTTAKFLNTDLAATFAAKTHATTHEPSGSDAMAADAAAGTASLRSLGATSTTAAAGSTMPTRLRVSTSG